MSAYISDKYMDQTLSNVDTLDTYYRQQTGMRIRSHS